MRNVESPFLAIARAPPIVNAQVAANRPAQFLQALRACRDTTGLLLDLDQTRCIFLVWSAMHIFRSHAFSQHDVVIEAAMEQ